MNIEHTPRPINNKISKYLTESIDSMESLDYYIEDEFNETDLYSILMEDLPPSDNHEGRDELAKDISANVAIFYNKIQSQYIRIQLKIVETDMCRLFHTDNNTLRLLCTYQGPATQWLEEDNINRCKLGGGDNSLIVKDLTKIKTAKKFDTLLLKGERFAHDIKGAVHRSPPIELKKEVRVLLTLDEYSDS